MTWQILILMQEPPNVSRRPLNAHMGQEKPYKAEIIKSSFFETPCRKQTMKLKLISTILFIVSESLIDLLQTQLFSTDTIQTCFLIPEQRVDIMRNCPRKEEVDCRDEDGIEGGDRKLRSQIRCGHKQTKQCISHTSAANQEMVTNMLTVEKIFQK